MESLYEKTSYLSQDTPVFDGTIRENLVFDRDVSDAELHAGLENVQLSSMLATLEKEVDTRIGEKGTCLSGGEKQRLALARLWFDDPEIVVLDEATSALDNVFVFKDGKIVGNGTFEELLANNSYFIELYRKELL